MRISPPLDNQTIEKLRAGARVAISGVIYTARDAAHKRLIEALNRGENLPLPLQGQILYYVGPTPARPGMVIGSAGPTTAVRMDPYTLPLLAQGLKGMIGKGYRTEPIREALKQYKAVYLAALSGAGALISGFIKRARVIAYEDLGAEAIVELEVEDFPVIVANDIYGGDVFEEGKRQYKKT